MTDRRLLIAGASGSIGQAVLEAFARRPRSGRPKRSRMAPSTLPMATSFAQALAQRENLAEPDPERIAPVALGDFIFHVEQDAIFDATKARRAGLQRMNLRSDEVLLAHLAGRHRRPLIP